MVHTQKNTINVYASTTSGSGFKHDLMRAFVKGVTSLRHPDWWANLIEGYEVKDGTHAFCFNYQRIIEKTGRTALEFRRKLIDQFEPQKKIFYFDSNVLVSYEKTKHHVNDSFVRIAYGNVYPDKTNYFNGNPKPDRWNVMKERLGIKVKDYDVKSGDKIYICCNRGSGGYSAFGKNAADWSMETVECLRQFTKRPIAIRLHSGQGYPTFTDDVARLYEFVKGKTDITIHSPNGDYPNLLEEIKNSYAVVNYTSTSGSPAILEGKPLFVTHKSSYLAPMNAGHLSDIEKPNLDLDRDRFLWGLGESHWTLHDIETSEYFKKFVEGVNE